MRVRLSGAARAYLRKETTYLRERNPAAARRFTARMAQARETLASYPKLGFGQERLPILNSNRLVIGDYLIDYLVEEGSITIVSIRHGAQRSVAFIEDDLDDDFDPPPPDAKP